MNTTSFFVVLILLLLSLSSNSQVLTQHHTEVLFIGDSHVFGDFGGALFKKLNSEYPNEVYCIGAVGATALTYTSPQKSLHLAKMGYKERYGDRTAEKKFGETAEVTEFKELIKKLNPKIAVIELGDNFADYKGKNNSQIRIQLQSMLSELKKSKITQCYWVSPIWTSKDGFNPYGKTNARLAEVIQIMKQEIAGQCQFIDSTKELGLNPDQVPTSGDGLHLTPFGGKTWGEAAGKFIIDDLHKKRSPHFTNQKSTQNSGTR